MIRHLATLALLITSAAPIAAQTFDTRATAAYVLDHSTGIVLLEKNADDPLPPASMSKLMTLYMAFEAINPLNGQDPIVTVDDILPVSQHCMNYTGSTMFLDTTDRVRVEDLLRGVIVLSGNDASCVLAEGLSRSGTEAGFAQQMAVRARELGMMNSSFANSNGWPAAGQRMSMRDLGILADRLITDYPTFYPLFSEQSFDYDGEHPANTQNRNPLLALGIGADGLKTGHTSEAGYGLVGSAKQGDRRVIFVITGLETAQARAEEAERIVNWAFRQFAQRDIARGGTRIAQAEVWMGDVPHVGLMLEEDLSLLVPTAGGAEIDAEVIFNGPIQAPVTQGDAIAELVIRLENLPETRVPLVADTTIAAGGFSTRLRTAADVLVERVRTPDDVVVEAE
ncbi:D-alanyl-D-alanine carboxypeptidase (penicillin-binding protein 5/6) [Octadecabacter temperatus]|uniref:serine-type D-Ala-D-Ala carboxypeptidase n=1 Tax=Octadecabacter temperatus TaxID=1458307 RepID=A0A0K0Y780_9RHOB|nr:D-alanyl-D-alanine carboxypeptidase family protein [Octadecabacter temperatus]AKS46717.1 D-alanyl-D-alanine carboxypeptidase DacD precursor [Octadecabacter temperatus]SIO19900.1 D-alanyl-D-alanine carboxypeptidase (penicillin-binding protein 5/6) [Octadecabacter temperatus]